MYRTLIIAFFCLAAYLLPAQSIRRPDGKKMSVESVDRIVRTLMDTAEVTGLQLGIINDNRPVYIKSYGYRNIKEQQGNDTATCFYGASLAKPLFAYLVMQLVDEGVLDLDKPLSVYYPTLTTHPQYTDLAGDERWKLITARQCLDHTAGFPNWRQFNPHGNKKLEIFFTPGSRYAYSGEGLYLLQIVIEHITGKGLEDMAQEKIFQPFNMYRSSFLWQPAFETDYAVGHDSNGEVLPKSKRTKTNAAGSMETTIADYTRFLSAVLAQKRVSARSWNELFTPQVQIRSPRQFPTLDTLTTNAYDTIELSYGLGWGLFKTPYGKAFFKEGHDDGWVHYSISFPEKKTAYVILCNSSNGESIFKELVEKLTGVTMPWEWEGYFPYRGYVTLPEATLREFTGSYTGRLQANVSFENGRLKIESPTTHLAKTNLYASNNHHFFLRTMDAEVDFLRNEQGEVIKALVLDEGEKYELTKKLPAGNKLVPQESPEQYLGSYQVSDHIFIVSKKDSQLFLESTNPRDRLPKLQLVSSGEPHSFYLKEVPIKCLFLANENGRIDSLRVTIGTQPPATLVRIK